MVETNLQSIQPLSAPNRPSSLTPMNVEGTPVLDRPPTGVARPIVQPQPRQSSLPTILAIAAAAQGNIQPLFHLQEQKRRTEVFRQLQPILGRASQFVEQGQYQEGLDYLSQAYSQFGARAPEIGQFIGQMQSRITNRMNNMQKLRTFVSAEKAVRKAAGDKYPKSYGAILDVLEAGLKGGKPADMAIVESIMSKYRLHVQDIGGAVHRTDPVTGTVDVLPYAQVPQVRQFETMEGKRLAGEMGELGYSFDPASLTNVFMGVQTTDNAGNELPPVNIEWMKQRFAELQKETGLIQVGKNIPLEPITAGHLVSAVAESRGVSPQEAASIVASRTYTADEDHAASKLALRDRAEVARAETLATADVNPNYKTGLNVTMFNRDTGEPNWNPAYTSTQGANNPSISFIPTSVFEGEIRPLYIVRNQMKRISQEYVDLLPDASNLTEWLEQATLATVSGRIPFSEVMSLRNALAAQLDSMIEQIPNPTNQQKTIMRRLKNQVTNPQATKQGAATVLNEFMISLQNTIDTRTRQNESERFEFQPVEIREVPTVGPGATMNPQTGQTETPLGLGEGMYDDRAR